ncbi:mechanosensitive ion channel protein MscS [Chlorobaculum limnaeum]|uniref:Mechanosensitive ion channel protein MscS n=1 Tax=Chlorobaculum limnaeum TaxID=274537 RepID=A0A1D8D0V5_CHLLM|nr:mechanosensitive ion channel domain-containing protein [Chlorobaculum limnaeum]AOS84041.1 mechanosensitive ion channel protein MscS [Chlorobaculum limnaeum]
MLDSLLRYIESFNIDHAIAVPLTTLLAVLAAVLLIAAFEIVIKKILLRSISHFAAKTATRLDDMLVRFGVFKWVARLAPPLLAYRMVSPVLKYYADAVPLVTDVLVIYFAMVVILLVLSVLDVLYEFYSAHPVGKRLPIKSIVQVFKTLTVSIGVVIVVSRLLDKSPVVLISGIGAFTAVLLLIFKDSILGLVAGIQLSTNDLVRIGDWIEMPKYGADGDVIDISLVTVSVQNFDKTIVVLPAYTLISEGFRNWRGMRESDGRRIKRSFNIDMQSIRFLDGELMKQMEAIQLLEPYMRERLQEIESHNRAVGADESSPVNGRRLTNLGTFRAYLQAYVRSLARINTGMTIIIRYLQPDAFGLPCEIYCFTKTKEWAEHEAVQSDILDHVFAVLPYFDLKAYQLQGALVPSPPAVKA